MFSKTLDRQVTLFTSALIKKLSGLYENLWVFELKNLPQGSPRAQCSQRIFSQRIQEISDKFDSIVEDAEFFCLWHEKLHFIFDKVKNLSATSKTLVRQEPRFTSALIKKTPCTL